MTRNGGSARKGTRRTQLGVWRIAAQGCLMTLLPKRPEGSEDHAEGPEGPRREPLVSSLQ